MLNSNFTSNYSLVSHVTSDNTEKRVGDPRYWKCDATMQMEQKLFLCVCVDVKPIKTVLQFAYYLVVQGRHGS